MKQFAPRKAPESRGKPNAKANQPNTPATQHAAMHHLQRTFGNQAMLQMLLNVKNATTLLTPEKIKLNALDHFVLTPHPQIMPAYAIMHLQIEAYTRILSAYLDHARLAARGMSGAFFWRYHPGFRAALGQLVRGLLLPNVLDFIKLLEGTATKDKNGDAARLDAAMELREQLAARANGEDLNEIEKQVPRPDTTQTKSPALAALERELAGSPAFKLDDKTFFDGFLQKNGINDLVFKLVIKTAEAWKLAENATAEDAAERLKQWRAEQDKLVKSG